MTRSLSSLAFLLLLALALAGAAAQAQPGASLTDGRNAYIFGSTVRPTAPVKGDFTGAGARIVIDQPVSGDVFATAGTIDVRAPIGDDVRVAGGDISIDAPVGGELLAAGGNITIERGGAIARGATVFAAKVEVSGRIDGSFEAHAQTVVIDGEVKGDVDIAAEEIELGPQARIGGRLTYTSAARLDRAPGAVVQGAITRTEPTVKEKRRGAARDSGRPGWFGTLMSFLALLACAAVFQLAAPAFASRAAQRIGSAPWLALGIGFAALVGVPVLAVVLFVTLIGIPLGLVVLLLYPLLLLFGFLTGIFFLADRAPALLRRSAPETMSVLMGYIAGTLLLVLLLALVPVLGGLLMFAVLLLGMGAFVLEVHARWRGRKAAAGAGAMAAASS